MKLYVASSLENIPQVQRFVQEAQRRGHTLTYSWWLHGPVFNPCLTRLENEELLRLTAEAELNGVVEADNVVVLLPGGRGTHVELGGALVTAAYLADDFRRVIVSGPTSPFGDLKPDDLCLSVGMSEDADGNVTGPTLRFPCFYWHPRVVQLYHANEAERFAQVFTALEGLELFRKGVAS
jgi:hypothetical protein